MKVHQTILRKNGPTHAVEFLGGGKYQPRALCGASVGSLAQTKARRFETADNQCQRCAHSLTLR